MEFKRIMEIIMPEKTKNEKLDEQIKTLEKMLSSARTEKLHDEIKSIIKSSKDLTLELHIYALTPDGRNEVGNLVGGYEQRLITMKSFMELSKIVDFINKP